MKENSIKETIKIIERKIKEAEHYSDITGLYLTLDEELRNALMNILSDYKRVLKEVKKLKEKYKKDTHTLQNQLDIANADRVEKDKIIKLMAKYIADNDTTEIFCDDDKFEIDAFGDEVDCDEDCQECVIRFFEEKVRNNNEII